MAIFTRHVDPSQVSALRFPGPLSSWSQAGKGQLRSTQQVGCTWVERYPPLKVSDNAAQRFLAMVGNYWRNGTTFDITHLHHPTPRGGGTGTALVNGAAQTGASLVTDGWGGTNPVLRAGDIIRVTGVPNLMQIAEDAPNLAGTATTLAINPPFFAGSSPADNAAITYTGVVIQAVLSEEPNFPNADANAYIVGVELKFREMP